MRATRTDRLLNGLGILAAMIYLASFLAVAYGCYAFVGGESFLQSLVAAYPLAFALSALLFAGCAVFEVLKANFVRVPAEGKPPTMHSLASR